MSLDRGWYFFFSPDIDLLEVTPEKTTIGYEAKGQTKGKDSPEWPPLYEGLDEAMAYLELPYVSKDGERMFDGGGLDMVYLVHPISKTEDIREIWKRIVSLTPIGYLGVKLNGESSEAVPAKPNPILDEGAKRFLIDHLETLLKFSEGGKTFRSIAEQGQSYCSQVGI
jgi:hypothetical protein